MIAVGALGCWLGGVASDRWGRTDAHDGRHGGQRGVRAGAIGLTFGGAPGRRWRGARVGVTVIADSAQFSTAVTELSPPAYVGTALTTQTCVGFALTTLTIWLIPPDRRRRRAGAASPSPSVRSSAARMARLRRRWRLRGRR